MLQAGWASPGGSVWCMGAGLVGARDLAGGAGRGSWEQGAWGRLVRFPRAIEVHFAASPVNDSKWEIAKSEPERRRRPFELVVESTL